MRLKIVFEPSDARACGDRRTSVCRRKRLDTPYGCISDGDTLDEARRNIREAIELYLEPDGAKKGDRHLATQGCLEDSAVSLGASPLFPLPHDAVEEEIVV